MTKMSTPDGMSKLEVHSQLSRYLPSRYYIYFKYKVSQTVYIQCFRELPAPTNWILFRCISPHTAGWICGALCFDRMGDEPYEQVQVSC